MSIGQDQIKFAIMKEAWADIRAYTSNAWQIMGLTLGVEALVVNAMLASDPAGSIIFLSQYGWFGMLFVVIFSFFALSSMLWILDAIDQRARIVEGTAEDLSTSEIPYGVIMDGKKVNGVIKTGTVKIRELLSWFPKSYLKCFFLILWTGNTTFWFVQLLAFYAGDTVMLALFIAPQILVVLVMSLFLGGVRLRQQKLETGATS